MFCLIPLIFDCLSSSKNVQDCPEFDLTFENGFDQWTAGSSGEKCVFVQILHHTCQRFIPERKPEFINCPAKLLGGETSRSNTLGTLSLYATFLEFFFFKFEVVFIKMLVIPKEPHQSINQSINQSIKRVYICIWLIITGVTIR